MIFIQENAFENVVHKMLATLFRPECVNPPAGGASLPGFLDHLVDIKLNGRQQDVVPLLELRIATVGIDTKLKTTHIH